MNDDTSPGLRVGFDYANGESYTVEMRWDKQPDGTYTHRRRTDDGPWEDLGPCGPPVSIEYK